MENKEAILIIEKLSPGKRKYEEKKAIKNDFASLYDSVAWKLEEPIRARWERRDVFKAKQLEKQIKLDKIKEEKKQVWKKTNKDGTPFFNIKYFFQDFPKSVSGINIEKTNTSKQMIEWFLKSFGHLNPLEMHYGSNTGVEDGEVTLSYIDTCLFFLFSKYRWNVLTNKMETNETTEIPLNIFQWFDELEHLITDNRMFWCIFEWIFTVQSKYFTDKTFTRYGRLNIPLEERLQSSEILNGSRNDGVFKDSIIDKSSKFPTTTFWTKTIFDNVISDEYVTVYCSFKVPKGETIKKGITLKNQDSLIHQAGNGFSYSLSKLIAVRLGWFTSSFIIKKYCKLQDDEAEKILQDKWLNRGQMENPTFFDEFYTCIGEFKVKKDKILFATGIMSEDEIIANPKDVILADYRFLNVVDTFAMQSCLKFMDGLRKKAVEDQKYLLQDISQFINLDGVFDYFYMSAKKYCNRNPKEVGYILKTGQPDLFYKFIPYVLDMLEEQTKKEYALDKKHSLKVEVAPTIINNRNMFEISADGFIFPNLNGSSVRQQTNIKRKFFYQKGFIKTK
tara:strand:+ start:3011 stop:4693 length:1683 start_codon:yes stop_codon:yes gene_type:complete